jgi:hypothetical protein
VNDGVKWDKSTVRITLPGTRESAGGRDSGTEKDEDDAVARRASVGATETEIPFGTYSMSEMSTINLRELGREFFFKKRRIHGDRASFD